jgi:GNAT superfamily N-acetyltransferase
VPEDQPVTPANDAVSQRSMQVDEADLELFRACFAKHSDRPRSLESLRWQYFGGPTGKVFVDFAMTPAGDRLAAVYATLPGFMRIGGERRVAVQSVDTLTDADYRGRGLFATLAKRTFARATDDGVALVYGFPNGSSAHGFFKKLGWSPIDPVPFLIRPLRLDYVADRLALPAAARALIPRAALVLSSRRRPSHVVELTRPDERLTRLWNAFAEAGRVGVAVERDEAYLRWRLFDKPGESYRVLASERGGELSAMCAFAVKDKHGGRIGYVMELLHAPGGERDARRLLGSAVRQMADEGADSVLAWCLPHSPTFRAFVRHAFFPLPEKLRPIELHAGVRAFDPAIAPLVTRRDAWYLSYLDSDTV